MALSDTDIARIVDTVGGKLEHYRNNPTMITDIILIVEATLDELHQGQTRSAGHRPTDS